MISYLAADILNKRHEELKKEPHPLKFGIYQKYLAYVPKREPDDILDEKCPGWWWYAEELRDYKETLSKTPFMELKKRGVR